MRESPRCVYKYQDRCVQVQQLTCVENIQVARTQEQRETANCSGLRTTWALFGSGYIRDGEKAWVTWSGCEALKGLAKPEKTLRESIPQCLARVQGVLE